MRVVRVYHAGRDAAHRERGRALVRAGVDLTLVVPAEWPGADELRVEPFEIVQLPIRRPGDVNRHTYRQPERIVEIVDVRKPDVVDLHEEPFSAVVHQLIARLPADLPVVGYAAQNIDKRFPPPFAQWERQALGRLSGIYPCSRQAASVVVGKGFRGAVRVLPLPPAPEVIRGDQQPPDGNLRMLLVGRLVPEKGVCDAVRVLAEVRRSTDASLELVGAGPEADTAQALASELGVADGLTITPWLGAVDLAQRYRQAQILLAPSRATRTWVEQFGRMVVEAHAAGAVVVGYASGALPEVVGDAGVLVPEGDVSALADAVRALAADAGHWQALRNAGLARATTCTWDSVASGQLELYEEACKIRPVGAVRPQRAEAMRRWGPPAQVAGGGRQFALPVLRNDTAASRAFARVIDRLAPADAPVAPDRLRVVYLDHVARLSGGELALLRLIQALPDIEAHVILGEDGPLRVALERAGATVEVLPLRAAARDVRRGEVGHAARTIYATAFTAAYAVRLARRLRQLRPDIVHTNSLKAGYYGTVAARLARVPVVWHLRDRVADDYLPPRAVRLTRALLRTLPDLVVCNSAETLRTAGQRVRAGMVIGSPVVHDPYDLRAARPRRREGNTIGMVGRLAEWKGQREFVQALAALRAEHPQVRGHIVGAAMFGEDAYEAALRRLVDELSLDGAVTFAGFVDQVEDELAGLDVLVHASVVPEPFGQVVVEGMAAGLPVVATAAGGPAEIITDGVNGLLVPPGDVQALTDALRRLLTDPGLRDRLGRAGVERAKDFAPDVIGRQMRDVYEALLARRGRRPVR